MGENVSQYPNSSVIDLGAVIDTRKQEAEGRRVKCEETIDNFINFLCQIFSGQGVDELEELMRVVVGRYFIEKPPFEIQVLDQETNQYISMGDRGSEVKILIASNPKSEEPIIAQKIGFEGADLEAIVASLLPEFKNRRSIDLMAKVFSTYAQNVINTKQRKETAEKKAQERILASARARAPKVLEEKQKKLEGIYSLIALEEKGIADYKAETEERYKPSNPTYTIRMQMLEERIQKLEEGLKGAYLQEKLKEIRELEDFIEGGTSIPLILRYEKVY